MRNCFISIYFFILLLFMGHVYADSSMMKGDLNFTGKVVSLPCKITFSSLDQNIDLGPISLNYFNEIGDRSPKQEIKLKFDDCIFPSFGRNDKEPIIRIIFISEPTKSNDRNLFGGKTILHGYGIRLMDQNSHIIPNGEYRNYPIYFDDNQQITIYSMLESYLPRNDLTVGNIKTQITLQIIYL
ncbi:putative exported fimbrial protein [Providencia burhodogranariea DSM 19968]|uniref:Putative exported fimbrial protein n=2 Tax=Providencia burhodogranariea TaxID=516074 RepID=K8WJM1_9GAMM|nr:putative exported fimbrial protein [Providencia burhodogranariea DSM 19968]